MKKNKFCQSCGMPMNRDPQQGGTEKDGSKTSIYCSYCYQNGKFSSPEIDSPEKMQKFCIDKMKEQGLPKIISWFLTRGIPKLDRWKNR